MSEIRTNIKAGDTVWWVHCFWKVYKGVVQSIDLCEGQGALYCNIYSPSFQRNQYPTVHYTNVFLSRGEAEDFAEDEKKENSTLMRCDRCKYNEMKRAIESEADNGQA